MIKLKDVSVSFGSKEVFKNFSAEIGDGVTCVCGPSGSGKSTFLKLIAGLIKPQNGEIEGAPSRPAFMFQEDRLFPWLDALGNVRAVIADHNGEEAGKWLGLVELSGDLHTMPRDMSGGMRRRVALSRALAFKGDLLILDEPFTGMDLPLVKRLVPIILDQGVPVIVSTHSPDEINELRGEILYVQ